MHYIFLGCVALGLASILMVLQYRKQPGTNAHALRGAFIGSFALTALGMIEYALWKKLFTFHSHPITAWIHLPIAITTLVVLVAALASGFVFWRKLPLVRPEYEAYTPLVSERVHQILVRKALPYLWPTTLVTGVWYFIKSAL